jgi:uncharacterized repeat protein (TIGR03803 family)
MLTKSTRISAAAALLFVFATPRPAPAQVVTILHTFTGGATDGQSPAGSLTLSASTLVGMTGVGGAGGDGTIFAIGTNGTNFNVTHSFNGGLADGENPFGALTLSGTSLFGLTPAGGSATNDGTFFQIALGGTGFAVNHGFVGGANDGSQPFGSVVQSGSMFYGMTGQGGTANLGAIFGANPDGSGFTILHSFTGGAADGQTPAKSALVVSGSKLYGMTLEGGSANFGTVFSMNADGTGFSLLHSFNAANGDGWFPEGSLALSGSTLYGMTRQGGGGAGEIFKINTDGTGYTIMHTFTGTPGGDGANPLGSLLIAGSEMYGMTPAGGTAGLGTMFEMGLDGTGYTVLHSFLGGAADGASPQADLIISGSTLFGMTSQGGSSNDGVIFAFTPVPEPSSLMLLAACGTIAACARRWRRGRRAAS